MDMNKRKAISISLTSVILLVGVVTLSILYFTWLKDYGISLFKSAEKRDLPENCDLVGISIKDIQNRNLTPIDHTFNFSYPHDIETYNFSVRKNEDIAFDILLEVIPSFY